jgi:hypothetical protein
MATTTLYKFIGANRQELIRRCRGKVADRSSPAPTEEEINHGVPLFLDQLVQELRDGPSSKTHAISKGAGNHGRDLLLKGFTVSQVVHDYGDVCQSITDLAVEMDAAIDTDDFRTMNRCLDDAIASAVTEYARAEEVTRDGESQELRTLLNTAISAFEVLLTGNVGVSGSTGRLLHLSLLSARTLSESPARQSPSLADPVTT